MPPLLGRISLVAVLAGVSLGAFAAESADLSVAGTIRPAACNISLSRTTLDYGTISATTLSDTQDTVLPAMTFDLSIICDAPTVFAIAAVDNRAGTRTGANQNAFGLGMVDNQRVDRYLLWLGYQTPVGDGNDVVALWGQRSGGGWETASYFRPMPNAITLWAEMGTTTPKAFTTIQQTVYLDTRIAPKNNLPSLTGGVPLDGSATLSLVYL